MYKTETYTAVVPVEDYIEGYVDVDTFLECCRACPNYEKVWSCPSYDFDVLSYWRKYETLELTAVKIIFDEEFAGKAFTKAEQDKILGQSLRVEKEKLSVFWEPAREADLSNPIREKYPFTICCEHMRTRAHTQWYDVDYLKEFEAAPVCRINPEDAAELGIEEGDTVRLYNDRGSVTMLAVLNPGEQRKAVHCPRSFLTREHIDGDLARTTFNEYNQACRNQSYFDCAVAIEKL